MVTLFLPSLHKVINILLSVYKSGVDDLSVEQGGAPGHGGQQPDDQDDLAFIVKGKPKSKKHVSDVLS